MSPFFACHISFYMSGVIYNVFMSEMKPDPLTRSMETLGFPTQVGLGWAGIDLCFEAARSTVKKIK